MDGQDHLTFDEKFDNLQRYVPFLERMLRAKKNRQHPRVQTLLDLITNKRRLTNDKIAKCEKALALLQQKIEHKTSAAPVVNTEQVDKVPKKSPSFSDTPDSPPPVSRSEVSLKPAVVIPTERSVVRETMYDKDLPKKPKAVTQPNYNEPSSSRNSDRDRYLSTKESAEREAKRRPRWNHSNGGNHVPHDLVYNRDEDLKYASRSSNVSRSTDRYIDLTGSRDRPDISASWFQHSDESYRNDRYADSHHRKPSSSSGSAPNNKSVFKRLGDKLEEKQYPNISITVDSDKRLTKAIEKSMVPLSEREENEIRMDNADRFGDIISPSIDLKDLEHLKRMQKQLSNEIEGLNKCKQQKNKPKPPPPEPSTSRHTATSTTKPLTSSEPKDTQNIALNASLFAAANPSNLKVARSNSAKVNDVFDALKSIDSSSSVTPPKDVIGTPTVASMVKQAMSGASVNQTTRPISPTALLAVNQVIMSKNNGPDQSPASPTPSFGSPPDFDLFTETPPEVAPVALEPTQRLALRYNPKPRSAVTRAEPSAPRDPRRNPSFDTSTSISPSYASPPIFTPPLLPLPPLGQPLLRTPVTVPPALLRTPGSVLPSLLRTPPHQPPCFNNPHQMQMPSHAHNQFHPNYQSFDQDHHHGHRSWMQDELPRSAPQTYGEYRKSRIQQQPQPPRQQPKPTTAVTTSACSSTTSTPKDSDIHQSPVDQCSDSPSDRNVHSQFDMIYRVNDYQHTANAVTSINSNIAQNFKIPKKKGADDKSSKPSEEKMSKPSEDKSTKASENKSSAKPSGEKSTKSSENRSTKSREEKTSKPPEGKTIKSVDGKIAKSVEEKTAKPSDPKTSSTSELQPISTNRDPRINREARNVPSISRRSASPVEPDSNTDGDEPCEVSTSHPNEPKEMGNHVDDLLKSTPQLNKLNLLEMLGKVVDKDQLQQIKRIINEEPRVESPLTPTTTHDDQPLPDDIAMPVHTDDESEETPVVAGKTTPLTQRRKPSRRRNELEKLNDDIRDMFISNGVVNATGRRLCTTISKTNNIDDVAQETDEEPASAAPIVPDDPSPKLMRITRRRNTICVARSPSPPTNRFAHSSVLKAVSVKLTPLKIIAKPAVRTTRSTSVDTKRKAEPSKRSKTPVSKKKISPKEPKSKAAAKEATASRALRSRNLSESTCTSTDSKADLHAQLNLLNESLILKNTNKLMYVQNQAQPMDCLLCEYRGTFMINHYANEHPNAENYVARLPPENGKLVKTPHKLDVASKDGQMIVQICLFCNETMSKVRNNWVKHFSTHTGEYQYQCSTCKRFSSTGTYSNQHNEQCGTDSVIRTSVYLFNSPDMTGYVCSLCNFTQFNRDNVVRHLANQHSKAEASAEILAVPFVRLKRIESAKVIANGKRTVKPTVAKIANVKKKKEQLGKPKDKKKSDSAVKKEKVNGTKADKEEDGDTDVDEEDGASSADDEEESIADNKDPNDDDEDSANEKPMPKLRNEEALYNADAFIARPKEVDCLFDKDTMRIMNDMSFSSGASPVTPPRLVATSMADKLNERFKSAQKDADLKESPGSSTPSPARRVLPFDVTLSTNPLAFDEQKLISEFEIKNDDIPIVNQAVQGVEALPKCEVDAKPVLTPVVADSDLTCIEIIEDEDEWEDCSDGDSVVDIDEKMVIEKVEPAVEGFSANQPPNNASNPTTPQTNVVLSKNMLIEETVNRLYMSIKPTIATIPKPPASPAVAPTDKLTTIAQPKTHQPISPQSVKTINRIDNLGFSVWNDVYAFCCLISDCGYESNRANICAHIVEHKQQWTGYCYMCDLQVHELPVSLFLEFNHMTSNHMPNDKAFVKINTATPKPSLKVRRLSGDMLSAATKTDEPSIMAVANNQAPGVLIRINNTNYLPTARQVPVEAPTISQPDAVPQIKISSVFSLGAQARHGTGSSAATQSTLSKAIDNVRHGPNVLKPWSKLPLHKSDEICKTMLQNLCLFSLFKCMAVDCQFSNSSPEAMVQHLRYHEMRTLVASSTKASWLECAYCDEPFERYKQLVGHVLAEHSTSIFQCPFCFYRSCAAHNVLLHIRHMHKEKTALVLVCKGKSKMLAADLPAIFAARAENVKAIKCCNVCRREFFMLDSLRRHMSTHNNELCCSLCPQHITSDTVTTHMLSHNVGIYECVYCSYGTNGVDAIREHMCVMHPNKLLYISCRVQNQQTKQLPTDSIDCLSLVYIGEAVDKKIFVRCPFSDQQLSYASPYVLIKGPLLIDSIAAPETPKADTSANLAKFGLEKIINISEIEKTFTETQVLGRSYEEHKRAETSVQAAKGPKTKPAEVPPPASTSVGNILITNVVGGVPFAPLPPPPKRPLTWAETVAPVVEITRVDSLLQEIDQAAYALVKGTGLEGNDLYRCAVPSCDGSGNGPMHFNVHMMKHTTTEDIQNGYKCYHCPLLSKNIIGLKYHIKEHGIHRYFCYYCNHTAPIMNEMLKHMEDTHKKFTLVTFPLNPKRTDQNKDMFVICPRGLRQEELNRFGMRLIERYKLTTVNKKVFAPDEIDMLPKQAIMAHLIKCAICGYSTKVRTNMVRHLTTCTKQRVEANAAARPLSDPVNPVPCLDALELHFDKMRNLAVSSQNDAGDLCGFVPEMKRFVCNANSCHYQTINETMLRGHLETLHPNEPNYKCPHCAKDLGTGNVNRIIFHLRMHSSHVYMCSKCNFNHFSKQTVEQHIGDTHKNTDAVVTTFVRSGLSSSGSSSDTIITASNTSAAVQNAAPPDTALVHKWRCMMCPEICSTRSQMVNHANVAHSIVNQYQCDVCNETQSNAKSTIIEHMNNKHPNENKVVKYFYMKFSCKEVDETTPIWRRDDPNKVKHIRGILFDEEKSTASKRRSKAPAVQQFSIPTPHGSTILSGSVATYTNIPNSDDDDDLIDVCLNDPAASVPRPSVPEPIQSVSRKRLSQSQIGGEQPAKRRASRASSTTTFVSSVAIASPTNQELLKATENHVRNDIISSTKPKTAVRPEKTKKKTTSMQRLQSNDSLESSSNSEIEGQSTKLIKEEKESPNQTSFVEKYMCGFCEFPADDLSSLKTHHKSEHDEELFETLATLKTNDEKITVSVKNGHKLVFTCKYCTLRKDTLDELYTHWQETHKFVKQLSVSKNVASGKKFLFCLDFNVRCAFCNYRISYRQMRSHFQRLHPEGPCATIHPRHRQRCGICGFHGDQDGLFEHYASEHPLEESEDMTILDRPIVPITQQMLSCLTLNGHRGSHKCLYCNVTFDFIEDYEAHHNSDHNSWPILVDVTPDAMHYGCTICDFDAPTELEVVQHLQHHNLYKFQTKFQCLICPETFKNKIEVRRHHTADHITDKRGWRLTPVVSRMAVYNRIKVIFPNGLFVFKAELVDTEFGSMTAIVTELNRLEAEELRNELHPPKGTKRRHEDDGDNDVEPSTSKKPSAKLEAPSAPAAKEFSYYGQHRKQQFDLKKLYTTMKFGENEMRVSCDRFAMLVNIDPKLVLKPVRLPNYLR